MSIQRFIRLLRQDISFELRHGMYTVYAVVCLCYVLLLRTLPESVSGWVLVCILFTDPTVLGFFFIGGMILLERRQNTLAAVFCTPASVGEYLAAKCLSLSLLSLVTSVFIALAGYGTALNWAVFIPAVVLASVWCTLLSIPFAVQTGSLNEYFITAGGVLMVLCVPVVDFILEFGWAVSWIFPTQAVVLLLKGTVFTITPGELAYSIIYLAGAVLVSWRIAERAVERHIVRNAGGGYVA